MSLLSLLLAGTVLLGHVAVCTWLDNRLHASPLPSRTVQQLEKWLVLAAFLTFCGWLAWIAYHGPAWMDVDSRPVTWVLAAWRSLCWAMLIYVLAGWIARRVASCYPGPLVANETQCLDVTRILGHAPLGDRFARTLNTIPGNQILHIQAQHKVLRIARLPAELEGLRIAQMTDLHLTGHFTQPFYETAVAHVNQWQPDLIMITGDLIDEPDCISWIPSTLGRLRAPGGVFAILGNHDQRLADVDRLRHTLRDSRIVYLGGRSLVHPVRGVPVLLAGNESPWFAAPQIQRDARDAAAFSILLSHSPDQLPWARRHRFDLMLSGHTHGGQIRLPWIGPIVCPSRYGVRYASGLFDRPPTLLHVSRGLAGAHPVRFNCPPELTLLDLRRGEG